VGEDTTTTAYTYNETIKKPVTPEKEGSIFVGWNKEIPYTMPAEDITIEAKFVVAEFTLTTIVENVKTEVIYKERRYKSYEEAKERIETFINFYNERRPHYSIGLKAPNQAHRECGPQVQCWKRS
jgi:hypothetical protein